MYLIFDTETNGFPPKARMTQLAFMLFDEQGNVLQQFESIIKPDGWEVPKEKFFIDMKDSGNTVSATIPIAIESALEKGKIKPGSKVLIAGFGVGYSWAAGIIEF